MFKEKYISCWEDVANNKIKNCLLHKYKHGQAHWDEDHITLSIIESLREIGSKIHWFQSNIVTEWKGYKQKGKQEQRSGDIGILVKIGTEDGGYIEGVAYYEAKKINFQGIYEKSNENDNLKNRYKAVNNTQIRNLLSYANIIDILLYHPYTTVTFPLKLFDFVLNGELVYPSEYYMGLKLSSALSLNLKGIKLDFNLNAVTEFNDVASKSDMILIMANSGFNTANFAHAFNDDDFFKNLEKDREEILSEKNTLTKKNDIHRGSK